MEKFLGAFVAAMAIFASLKVYSLEQQIRALERRMMRTQALLRQVAGKLGLPEDPLEAEVRQLLAQGQTIQAIKRVREVRGVTLREAKEFVDSV